MSKRTGSTRQTLIAAAVVVVIALLALQTYALFVVSPKPGLQSATGASQTTGVGAAANATISVSGTGLVQIRPDRAVLTIGVITQALSAGDAVQENANMMSGVISALEGIGISNSSIQTTSYSIYPQSSCCNGPPTITGYQVTNQVQVTVIAAGESLAQLGAKAGQAIDVATSKGANQVYGISFSASNAALRQAQQTALQQAVLNASAQAHVLASALGVTVTGVVSATTSQGYTPPVYYATANSVSGASTPVIAPQSLTVSASVQVVYAIS